MKCTDCDEGLMPRPQLRLYAINLSAAIAGDSLTAEQRSAFACYSLLMVGELGTRCRGCADARIMAGVTAMAEKAAP